MTWAQRIKRVFGFDVSTCVHCGGAVRIVASIEEPTVVAADRKLTHRLVSFQCAATLEDSREHRLAHARLSRSISRLVRAAQTVLWLATDCEADLTIVQPVLPLVRALVGELEPLAASVGKSISIDLPADLLFRGPLEIAEVIFANLLLNAIQHGAGPVHVAPLEDGVVISNAVVTGADAPGFGFGREIVDRLASRAGWRIARIAGPGQLRIQIRFA